jgi:hypothetical protein
MADEERQRILQLVGLTCGEPHELAGQYVVSYDPEYHLPDGGYDGGDLVCTPNAEEAMRFESVDAAIKLWQSGPTCECHRLEPDGRPNKPLTAFDASVESWAMPATHLVGEIGEGQNVRGQD